jgi:serine/threonine protein kinase
MKRSSPWESYEKKYDLKLDDFVTVATRKPPSYQVVTTKRFPTQESKDKVHNLQHLRHENLVAVLDIFIFDDSVHVVLEHMPVSLAQVVASPVYPNERQLAVILKQVSSADLIICSKIKLTMADTTRPHLRTCTRP